MNSEERFLSGHIAEEKFEAILKWNLIPYSRTGQENFLPPKIREKLRYNLTELAMFLKHLPDYVTDREFIQVKSAPKAEKYTSVTIERASFDVSKKIYNQFGINVYMVWFMNNTVFHGSWINKLTPHNPETDRAELSGSKTPMYLIYKDQIKYFDPAILKPSETAWEI